MINISDNSATDHLIHYLGRAYVEGFLPSSYDVPLLTTAESFKLRYLISDTDLNNYIAMSDGDKRNYLNTTIANLDVNDIPSTTDWTANIDVEKQMEWFFNITEIYYIQNLTKNMDSTHMNGGLAWIGMSWNIYSYKGGSDTGVYAMAHAVYNGTKWVYVTFTANNYDEFRLQYGYIGYVPGQIGYEAICMKLLRKLN
jgi:beta-lactamase class A